MATPDEEERRRAAIELAKKLQAESKAQAALDLLEPLLRANPIVDLLDATASALFDLGRVAEARARRERAIDLHHEAGDKAGESGTLFLLGAMDVREGKFVDARMRLERSLALRRAIGDRAGTARVLHKLGTVDLVEVKNAEGRRHLEEALEIKQELGEMKTKATALLMFELGTIDLREGRHSEARPKFEQWLEFNRAAGNRVDEASTLRSLGTIDYVTGNHGRALEEHRSSLAIWQDLGRKAQEATTLNSIAAVAMAMKDMKGASAALTRAHDIVSRLDDEAAELDTLENIGLLAWKRGLREIGIEIVAICFSGRGEGPEKARLMRGLERMIRAAGVGENERRALMVRAAERYRDRRAEDLVRLALHLEDG